MTIDPSHSNCSPEAESIIAEVRQTVRNGAEDTFDNLESQMVTHMRRADNLPNTSWEKEHVRRLIAHETFMLASVQCDDLAKIERWFHIHTYFGFSSQHSYSATICVMAQCYVEHGEKDCAAALIRHAAEYTKMLFCCSGLPPNTLEDELRILKGQLPYFD